jgi:ParB-like chromosome segregation protein Spo0J
MKIENRPYAELMLEAPGFQNPRRRSGLDTDSIRELALHIGTEGLQYPLRVTPAGVITGGQRRYMAIALILAWRDTLMDMIAPETMDAIAPILDARAAELRQHVPCVLDEETDLGKLAGRAIADNLQREPMAAYDVAEQLVRIHDDGRGDGVNAIARSIGRSPTYVSRMLSTWRNACPILHTAWAAGQLPYEQVRQLAELPEAEQVAALQAGVKPRGSHGRPGIDAIKTFLSKLQDRLPVLPDQRYARGLLDAWRVSTGEITIDQLELDGGL